MNKNDKKMNNKGFSLVELIIVIAIMAILVGALAPQFFKYLESSRQSTDIDSIATYKTAVEAAVMDSAGGDGSISGAEITITTGGGSSLSKVKCTIPLTDVGLSEANTDVNLKSKTWPTVTYKFGFDESSKSYKWTGTAETGHKNTASPEKDMDSVFK